MRVWGGVLVVAMVTTFTACGGGGAGQFDGFDVHDVDAAASDVAEDSAIPGEAGMAELPGDATEAENTADSGSEGTIDAFDDLLADAVPPNDAVEAASWEVVVFHDASPKDGYPDTGCAPDCDDRVCGPDGCGGWCGEPCPGLTYCRDGTCEARSVFHLGMFGPRVTAKFTGDYCGGSDLHVETQPVDPDTGHPSSQLTVLARDGFDLFTNYMPASWDSVDKFRTYLELVGNVSAAEARPLQVMTHARMFFRPQESSSPVRDDIQDEDHLSNWNPCRDQTKPTFTISKEYKGESYSEPKYTYSNPLYGSGALSGPTANVYDNAFDVSERRNDPTFACAVRPDYDFLIDHVYSNDDLRRLVWGHQITEEASYRHFHDPWNRVLVWDHPCNEFIEVPPQNASDAMRHFGERLSARGVTGQKIVVMEASHGRSIYDGTIDCEWPFSCESDNSYNIHDAPDYVTMAGVTNPVKPDVFIDGSYYQFPQTTWVKSDYDDITGNGWHYLGRFPTIEWARKYVSEVHSDLNIENYDSAFHSNAGIKNGNYLWFQAYTSIIHRTDSLWFWELNSAWVGDRPADWDQRPDRFEENNFPTNYRKFVRHLGREIRFLMDRGLVGTDPNSVLSEKTYAADARGILASQTVDLGSLNLADKARFVDEFEEWRDGGYRVRHVYSVRYTLRTSGSEVVLITTNPVPVPATATFDFAGVANPLIQAATGAEVLFDASGAAVDGSSYKVDRDSGIDLSAGTVTRRFPLAFQDGRKLVIPFGPLDVRVVRFVVPTPVDLDNGWERLWSNFGSGNMDGVGVSENLALLPGDYRGEGRQSLLTIMRSDSGSWATDLPFDAGDWDWGWSNYGSGRIADWVIQASDRFVVGDFDGDGADELFCIRGRDDAADASLYRREAGEWTKRWSNLATAYGPAGTLDAWAIRAADRYVTGDFDHDGRQELLCIEGADAGARAMMLHFDGTDWIRGWSNGDEVLGPAGSLGGADGWTIRAGDEYHVGDFDGDGVRDDLLCVQRPAGGIRLLRFDGQWVTLWRNAGDGGIGGWGPLEGQDQVLVGPLDADGRDEVMFLQRCPGCKWATTLDWDGTQFVWRWSTQPDQEPGRIDDWPVADTGGVATAYQFVRPVVGMPDHLLAIRRFANGQSLVNLYRPLPRDF